MTIQQMIWRSSDKALMADQASYLRAIQENKHPEMIPHWEVALELIERELDQRHMLAWNTAGGWGQVLVDAPF